MAKEFKIIEHTYDVVIVGAGGAGLRAALGMAGVALRAGARSAVASLWSVNDQATADFVVEFYGQLSKPGHSRARALQHAQVQLLKTRHYRHPGYWAPFLLISSWL